MINNRHTGIVVLFLQLLLACLNPAPAQGASQEDEVRKAVSAFDRAYMEADVSYLQSRLTQEYIHINGSTGNVFGREDWLSWVQSRRARLASGELKINAHTVDDLMVKIYGHTAVVTGVINTQGLQAKTPFTLRLRFTNTWVKLGEVWFRAMFHDSVLDMKES